ncbi:hypothetical protein HanIR_Chr04g0150241 [Helianthus annuus]|nr:hypothetical protein HanIR_Chr04g0150241 [Helianthus annuus]
MVLASSFDCSSTMDLAGTPEISSSLLSNLILFFMSCTSFVSPNQSEAAKPTRYGHSISDLLLFTHHALKARLAASITLLLPPPSLEHQLTNTSLVFQSADFVVLELVLLEMQTVDEEDEDNASSSSSSSE